MWPFRSSTVTIAASGLLRGATEWHCHLLPGVDDGVKQLDETIATLRLMKSVGIEHVQLTPHVMEDVPNQPADLRRHFDELQAKLAADATVPALSLGTENMLDNLLAERLADGNLQPMVVRTPGRADTLLVETSFANPPMGLYDLLADIRRAGYFPLLAHPERYLYMTRDDYRRLRADGVMMQLNLPSLVGFYGPAVQSRAEALLKDGIYDLAGSDSHSLRWFQRLLDAPVRRSLLSALAALYGR